MSCSSGDQTQGDNSGDQQAVKFGDMIKVHYTLKLENDSVVETSKNGDPMTVKIGAGGVIPGFENGLVGMTVGETKTITVPPEEGYGMPRQDLIVKAMREQMPPDVDIKPGAMLQGQAPNGQMMPFKVLEIVNDTVILDANHPMAGKTLTFDLELVEIVEDTASGATGG